MTETPRRSRWRKILPVLFSVALAELLLRAFLLLRVTFGTPPGCGTRPAILGPLYYAYGGGRCSMLSVDADMTVYDPHRGYKDRPLLRERMVSGAPLSTNSRGLRGTRELAVPKPPGVVRVVALGDSLTFGEGVDDDETWPAQLETAVPGIEVANLGERAYAHDQMYYALQDDGLALDPDAVIVGFYDNDVWRDTLTYYCYEKPRFSQGPSGWQVENVPVPPPAVLRDRYLLLPLVFAAPVGLVEAFSETSDPSKAGLDRVREIFRRMRALAEARGARFIVVNIPEHPEAAPEPHGFFQEYCATAGAECVDPWPLFRQRAGTDDPEALRSKYLRPHDIHYSREGYAVVAEALRRHFIEQPIVRVRTAGHP